MKHRDNLSAPPATAFRPPARIAAWLVQRAAHRTPLDLRPRLGEEWLADLSAQSGVLSQLRFALGCCWATQVIAHDPLAFGVTARGAVAGHGAIAAVAHGNAPPSSSRSTVVMLALALHVVVIYAFLFGLIPPLTGSSTTPIQFKFFPTPKSPPLAPPGPIVQLTRWKTVPPLITAPPNVAPMAGETIEHVDPPRPTQPFGYASTLVGALLAIRRSRTPQGLHGSMPVRWRWPKPAPASIEARQRTAGR